MKRVFIITTIFLSIIVLIVPTLVVVPYIGSAKNDNTTPSSPSESVTVEKPTKENTGPAITVSVLRSEQDTIHDVSFRKYLVGVVASEMPADFHIEALKAQALAARTFIVKQLMDGSNVDLPKKADVTDTVMDQVFHDFDQLKDLWGSDFEWKIEKIRKAVSATSGQIITYEGEPILPSFFSTSNGYTENSEDYWPNALPYLKSVKSPWDKSSPKYYETESIPTSTVEAELGINIQKSSGEIGDILKQTEGNRVGKVKIAGKVFSGREVRTQLGLRSTDFELKKDGDTVYATTWGYGHGVGMSQYGANGMAKEGYGYKDIIKHYYQGVNITKMQESLVQDLKEKV